MVDTDGLMEVASETGRGKSRKVDQTIHTMGQYNTKIITLQEAKWFGSNVYRSFTHFR